MTRRVAVIGAGICGVSTAIWLQRSGHEVLLIDKGAPGMGASFGNAGLLAHWAVDPVTAPGLWRDAAKFLLNPNGPLFIKWSHLPGLLPWLVKFMSNATDVTGKFGVTPMDTGLRCAGTVELADHYAGPSKAPVKLLKNQVAEAFPTLTYSRVKEWMGFRPTPADSTPLIGQIGSSGIYTGFGHQHIGLTAGPKTGRLIAQLIDGNASNIDMRPYSPERFN